ncbi:MAG: hypothetical protein ACLPXB_17020 [Thiobacillaceae bacterium]
MKLNRFILGAFVLLTAACATQLVLPSASVKRRRNDTQRKEK